jgi:putative transposase
MPRAHRVYCEGLVWHVTHRCHQREFLLRFSRDRRRWRHWLFEAKRRYKLCVLNYVATSNHVHLLVVDQGKNEIAPSMQLIAGRIAQEYNRRKKRKGAFWEDRYHATAVQTDHHLIRCLSYIDLNMVRAGVVCHPREWEISGYHEIRHPRQRKGVIDHAKLLELVGETNIGGLRLAHSVWIDDALKHPKRDPVWTESVAIGDEGFVTRIKAQLGVAGMYRQIVSMGETKCLSEDSARYSAILESNLVH